MNAEATNAEPTTEPIELSSERMPGEGHTQRYRLRFPANMLYFEGHFDGDPLIAAVVQLDVVLLERVERLWPDLGHLTTASRLKFKTPIRPEDEVTVQLHRPDGVPRVQFTIDKEGEVCASGTLKFESP